MEWGEKQTVNEDNQEYARTKKRNAEEGKGEQWKSTTKEQCTIQKVTEEEKGGTKTERETEYELLPNSHCPTNSIMEKAKPMKQTRPP